MQTVGNLWRSKMKKFALIPIMIICLILPTINSASAGKYHRDCDEDPFRGDDISVDIDDGVIIIECEDYDDIVEIDEDYQLFINGREIKTDSKEKRLLRNYYHQFEDITEYAMEIGAEGARIGVKGASLGLKAVANLVKLVLEDYDSDDLERDMEKEADKIEKAAKRLEKKAEKLEDVAEDFKRTHRKLRRSIDELDELEWF